MSLLLVIGFFGVLLAILLKGSTVSMVDENNKLVYRLKNAMWFQNHWLSGVFLFIMNGCLFFSSCLALYVLMHFLIPFVHLIVMFVAVIVSIYLWALMNKSWEGTKRNRLKMAAVGSGFYLVLTFIFVYWLATLTPSYPEEDTFMRAIGLFFAIIVASVASIACFVVTGFSKKENDPFKIK
ncbi:membrane protein [Bacillus sp. FJAT-27231]|uniref:hypothetical protein n=1 Tax=Bacillus sp. FJAT-27231 TaxID=1679168 RepID=UPI00067099DF|nr:hypothetical protein [Bacillus sp. FJAT-27231]KMY54128.1 membrane protein [Bacillus sp. FJAT-27231]